MITKPPFVYSRINIGDVASLLNILCTLIPVTSCIRLRLKYVSHIIEALELIIGESK